MFFMVLFYYIGRKNNFTFTSKERERIFSVEIKKNAYILIYLNEF